MGDKGVGGVGGGGRIKVGNNKWSLRGIIFIRAIIVLVYWEKSNTCFEIVRKGIFDNYLKTQLRARIRDLQRWTLCESPRT